MDTIIFLVLLVGGVFAGKGAQAKIVVPIFLLAALLTFLLYEHHVTDTLGLSF